MSERMPRCRGLWGWIVGHKFKQLGMDTWYPWCARCGMAALTYERRK